MDIVEKLRNQALGYGTTLECAAADEIERLRNDNKALKYSLQLDEDLIGKIKEIISTLNSRPDTTPNMELTGGALTHDTERPA